MSVVPEVTLRRTSPTESPDMEAAAQGAGVNCGLV